jgi:hypothetical protein
VFCGASSCGRHPCACLPTTATRKKPWAREVASPAQVRLPRARRGSCACPRAEALGDADRLCRSVSSLNVEDVKFRLLARALRLCRRRLFSRSMICTRVVQAKPCPDNTSSTNSLSVFWLCLAGAHPLARALARWSVVDIDAVALACMLLPQQKRVAFLPLSSLFRGKHDSF